MATPSVTPTLVSSLSDLQVFLDSIPPSSTLCLDLEGKDLSRNGTLSIMSVLVHPTQVTFLIDVQTLGSLAFITSSTGGKTLKAVLEDPNTPKYFWDVRNDADALWAHYQVRLAGVTDVQLLENASRAGDKTYVRGLSTCVEKDLRLKFMELHRWLKTKNEVQALMKNDIFARRPFAAETMQYCANDVVYLPALHSIYTTRIDDKWMEKVGEESARRVTVALGPAYDPQSKAKVLGPWGSGLDKTVLTIDELLEKWEDDSMDAMQEDMLGYDDYDDIDDYPLSSKDAAWDDTFDSCWDKN